MRSCGAQHRVIGQRCGHRPRGRGGPRRQMIKVTRQWSKVLALGGISAMAMFGIAACGSSSSSSGKQGGTMVTIHTKAPDYLDPQLAYTVDAWTAEYNTYIPLLTFAHAEGAAGTKVIPGLAKSLPKVTNAGKT